MVRPLILTRQYELPLGVGLGMVVAERVIDLVAALAMLAAVLLWIDTPAELAIGGGSIALAELGRILGVTLVLPALLGTAALVFFGEPVLALVGRIHAWLCRVLPSATGLLDRALALAGSFVEGFSGLRRPGRLLAIIGLSALIWIDATCMYLLLAYGFGIEAMVGFGESMGVMVVTMFGSLLPSPPGMAGVQEAFGRAGLALYGVRGPGLDAIALAFAVIVHWWQIVLQASIAIGFMKRSGLSVVGLARGAKDFKVTDAKGG